jgi:hypothetical protein
MKTKIFALVILMTVNSTSAFATTLFCEMIINSESLVKIKVETKFSEKVFIGEAASVRAYVTEKENQFFSLEAFIPEYESRIYGEGYLNSKPAKINVSLWGRERLIEVNCSPLQ